MAKRPKTSLNALAHWHLLFAACSRKSSGISLSFIREQVSIIQPDYDRDIRELIDGFVDMSLMDESPIGDDEWTIAEPIKNLFNHLEGRYEATLSGGMQGALEDLRTSFDLLKQGIEGMRQFDVEAAYNDMLNTLRRALYASREHSRGIEQAVSALKRRDEAIRAKDRYQKAIHLHDYHLIPVRGLIEVGGPFMAVLDALASLIRENLDGPFGPQLSNLRVYASKFRRESLENFESARGTLMPLYNSARKDHHLAMCVSKMISSYQHHGSREWHLDRWLKIDYEQVEHLFTGEAVTSYLAQIISERGRKADAGPRTLISSRTETMRKPPAVLFASDVIGKIRDESTVVEDLFGHLFDQYPDQPEVSLMRLYGDAVLHSPKGWITFSESTVRREYRGITYQYNPVSVAL